ncbi:MAG: sigma-54-dependent transcriptional regulator [Verrucomicrobiota bacterium]
MKHLLIVDDERGSRESLKAIFADKYRLSLTSNAAEASDLLSKEKVDLILLDVIMPEKDGLAFLKEIQSLYPDVPVVMVSASTSVRPVVEAMQVGAHDYVTKPFDVEEIRKTVKHAISSSSLRRRVRVLQTDVSREYPVDSIVGESRSFNKALENARKAAESDSTVLIFGESGTGKELVARSIHEWSKRRDEPFVAVHCAALPENLMESELFGHEKGAFTSAEKQKAGRFDLAASGSLFFDEVGEMSQATQVKLLRVLQEHEFMRVGGTRIIQTDARIIAASARDMREEVHAKRFRDDLYYRLSVIPVRLPPLRERREDIPLLAQHFLDFYRNSLDSRATTLSGKAMDIFLNYAWPGNVRELKNVIERMVVLHKNSKTILPEFLPEEMSGGRRKTAAPPGTNHTLAELVGAYERRLIEDALEKAGGIQTKAARILGTTRRILKYRMEKLNIDPNPGDKN